MADVIFIVKHLLCEIFTTFIIATKVY